MRTYELAHSSNRQNGAERIFRVARIQEEQLTSFLVENQARFYRLAYSYLKNREEALDAVCIIPTKHCRLMLLPVWIQ